MSYYDYTSYWALPRFAAPQPGTRDGHDPVPTGAGDVTSPTEFVATLVLVAVTAVAAPVVVALAPATVMVPIGIVLAAGLGATGMLTLRERMRKWVGVRGAPGTRRPVGPVRAHGYPTGAGIDRPRAATGRPHRASNDTRR